MSFIDEDRFGGDDTFIDSIDQIATVVATFSSDTNIFPKPTGTVILGEESTGIPINGYIPNIPKISNSMIEGMVSAPIDSDGLVRRLPLLYKIPDGWTPSFATQVLKTLVGADTYIIKTNEAGIEEIKVQGLPETKVDSLGRKWISWVDTPEISLMEMENGMGVQDIQGKFVFVGVTAKGVMPQLSTSSGELLEPHKIQAALAESILVKNSPVIPYWHLALELAIFVISGLLIWLLTQYFGLTLSVTMGVLVMISTASYGYWSIKQGILIDVTWSLIGQFIIASTSFYFRFREQFKLRQQIKKQFEHYLDPRQVKRLQNNPELLKLGGEKRYCTYMFTDVRGFTPLTEKLKPEEVTYIMNKVLTIQANAVKESEGMVDKYIGDAMMACWNAPLDVEEHENKAIDTAIEIILGIRELNKELKMQRLPKIKVGIGINSGEAIVGNMGSEDRFEFTSLGDPVNLCARLESSTKEQQVDILIGESTQNNTSYNLTKLDDIMVKGKSKPIGVYTYEVRK